MQCTLALHPCDRIKKYPASKASKNVTNPKHRLSGAVSTLLLTLLLATTPAAAQSPAWTKTTTGCQVWNPWPPGKPLA